VQLADLLTTQLAGVTANSSRYSLSGQAIVLKPTAALSLGLIVHELAMNAQLHGALSVASGHIAIRWKLTSQPDGTQYLLLDWEEGGHAVDSREAEGLGCELVRRQLRHELRGDATLDFTDNGLVARLSIPFAELCQMQ
jgi:two-component system, chemotaxis family, CheB/CheR fusion protein